jgi:LPS sulfotransferase NodH
LRPRDSYLICCVPRTGSWLLAESLESTGIAGRPKEYFAPERQDAFNRLWQLSAKPTFTIFLEKALDAGTTPNGIFGAKAHWYQFQDLLRKARQLPRCADVKIGALMPSAFPNLRYIWLTRQDKIRQAVSYYRATQTLTWWKLKGEDKTTSATSSGVIFDLIAIDRLLEMVRAHEIAWQGYFSDCGVEPLVVNYEDLAQHRKTNIVRILQYLKIRVPPRMNIPHARLKRQADAITDEWVEEYCRMKSQRLVGEPKKRDECGCERVRSTTFEHSLDVPT